jgi:UDPglucose 6-dehydrogenase/UDP-N-acetyl-D-galactosamine dehydrogenase
MKKTAVLQGVVCVVGLGYIGLPLAQAFAKSRRVIGFDTDSEKLSQLKRGGSISGVDLRLTADPGEISEADFIIICVPTPVTKTKEPDLSHVKNAAADIGRNMKKHSVVITESTVYPGVIEEIVKPILERESGLRCGKDFKIAYSPERMNPGDKEHSVDKIAKVVAGMDEETTELVAELYSTVTPHVFKAKDIRTAEAAKVIENIQRDLNIALMNELSIIFSKLGLNTKDILDAAATKWNFHRYSPGLVGGACIPVNPYYLVYKARELGYHPQVILAGRAINDNMPKYVAEMAIRALNNAGKAAKDSKVLIMGLTYKENVADIRESPASVLVQQLKEWGVEVFGYDPLLDDTKTTFGIKVMNSLRESPKVDCIILAVAHDSFKKLTLNDLENIMSDGLVLIDVRGLFNESEVRERGGSYYTL